MIEEARGPIDYDEHGRGPTVVLVPGSFSTGAAWRPVIAQWGGKFRCVTTSLLGYGGTAERRHTPEGDIARQAEIVESVIRRTRGPVHLVGHSFGGLAALSVALRQHARLLSLTLVEAPAVALLRHMGEQPCYRAFQEMTDAYFAAHRRGAPAAVEPLIDFYGGPGTFASWPERVRSYAVETTAVNVRDWADAYAFKLTPPELATIDVPTLVIWGAAGHPAVRRANALLAECIRRASTATLPDAGHFMIITHAPQVARLIASHVARAEHARQPAAA